MTTALVVDSPTPLAPPVVVKPHEQLICVWWGRGGGEWGGRGKLRTAAAGTWWDREAVALSVSGGCTHMGQDYRRLTWDNVGTQTTARQLSTVEPEWSRIYVGVEEEYFIFINGIYYY